MKLPDPENIRQYLSMIERKPVEKNDLVKAAVFLPVIARSREYDLLFTKRSRAVEHHKGQISFPGGVCDPSDKDSIATALREMEEEIGISQSAVCVLGTLNDFGTPTGFQITPVVGLITTVPELRIQKNEVVSVFYVPLSFFVDPDNVRIEKRRVEGIEHKVFYYYYGSHTIWGATAFMIREFLKTIRVLSE